MAGVPYTFATASTTIPLSQLDTNFQTPITIGATNMNLGQVVTTISSLTLTNVTISSGNVTITNAIITGGTISNTTLTNVTLANATISSVFNPLTIAQGGTNVSSITANAVIIGNGTSSIQTVSPGTAGNVLTSNGTNWVSQAGGAVTNIANGTSNVAILSTNGNVTSYVNGVLQSTLSSSGLALTNSLKFNDSTTQTTAFTTTPVINTINSQAATPLIFGINGTEAFRVDSSQNVRIGTTSTIAGEKLSVYQSAATWAMFIQNNANNSGLGITNGSGTGTYTALAFYNNGTSFSACGTISISGSSTSYLTSSDYRLKENIAPMTGALAQLQALKPITYKWKTDGSDGQGFIAHELAEVCPQAVHGKKDAIDDKGNPIYQGIDTSKLVATLTAAIQELNAKVEAQAEQIKALIG